MKNFSASNFTLSFLITISFSFFSAYPAYSDNSKQSVNRLSILVPKVYLVNFGKCTKYSCHSL